MPCSAFVSPPRAQSPMLQSSAGPGHVPMRGLNPSWSALVRSRSGSPLARSAELSRGPSRGASPQPSRCENQASPKPNVYTSGSRDGSPKLQTRSVLESTPAPLARTGGLLAPSSAISLAQSGSKPRDCKASTQLPGSVPAIRGGAASSSSLPRSKAADAASVTTSSGNVAASSSLDISHAKCTKAALVSAFKSQCRSTSDCLDALSPWSQVAAEAELKAAQIELAQTQSELQLEREREDITDISELQERCRALREWRLRLEKRITSQKLENDGLRKEEASSKQQVSLLLEQVQRLREAGDYERRRADQCQRHEEDMQRKVGPLEEQNKMLEARLAEATCQLVESNGLHEARMADAGRHLERRLADTRQVHERTLMELGRRKDEEERLQILKVEKLQQEYSAAEIRVKSLKSAGSGEREAAELQRRLGAVEMQEMSRVLELGAQKDAQKAHFEQQLRETQDENKVLWRLAENKDAQIVKYEEDIAAVQAKEIKDFEDANGPKSPLVDSNRYLLMQSSERVKLPANRHPSHESQSNSPARNLPLGAVTSQANSPARSLPLGTLAYIEDLEARLKSEEMHAQRARREYELAAEARAGRRRPLGDDFDQDWAYRDSQEADGACNQS
eukprot:gnl/MRDRNA2_/MRDRNA2_97631_c0_seq1.p1 gnl/MRDRNA2_/MRDRNA2_97631_c0~~gnl/MRDRNA2_/MRDRNA2_97631_c0_seq1.p1  ORF type:complete len:672 (+),score=138.06 gnl/MRDRNA2_/MRDRNA2_97631_c0_seq1:148-2016(+)